jgi:pimeloyl-ACP methyl ester carboxylesterase
VNYVTRRNMVMGITGASLAGAISATADTKRHTTFVLVHGAWHGGWCWRRVSDLLEANGHRVFTPTLSGLCERSHLLGSNIDLTTHIMDVVNLVRWEDLKDIVLCGHSYGGFVISGAAEQIRDRISSIVFLDAFLPDDGESLASQSALSAQSVKAAEEKNLPGIPPIPAAVFRVNERDRAWVDQQCTPQPVRTFAEKIRLSGAREQIGRKTYIRARGFPAAESFDKAFNKAKGNDSWTTHELVCGHDAMLDMPESVADCFLNAL